MSENTNTANTNTTTQAGKSEPLPVKGGQFYVRTPWLIGFLILALLVLKTFIYTKDKKRHGK